MKNNYQGNQNARKPDPKDERLTIRIRAKTKQKALRDAKKRDMSVSDYLELIILAQK